MRDLETGASGAAEARVVGNLAGVVEWANDAFARLSGVGLDETVNKPVGRLLERAGVDLEIVEFVAQHFFEGRVCRVAFPFERPDGRRIDVLLEVEALRDSVGEIHGFSAIARENPEAETTIQPPAGSARPSTSEHASQAAIAPIPRLAIDLNAAIRRGVEMSLARHARGPRSPRAELDFAVELDLEEGLEQIAVPRDRATIETLEALVASIVEAARLGIEEAENAGGVISVSTARLAAQRRFVSRVHAIAACPAARTESAHIVLEIHDTGLALPPAIVAAFGRENIAEVRAGDLRDVSGTCAARDASARVRALADVWERARALGARIHLDSTPGCGNQLLVLFTPAGRSVAASTPEGLRASVRGRLADSTQAR